jgi:2-oxoisovalerate dehydrogenase E1 component alpha subunit
LDELQEKAAREVDEATDYAEKAPTPSPESALNHVFVNDDLPGRG